MEEEDENQQIELLLTSLESAATAEKRVAALHALQAYVASAARLSHLDQLTAALKTQLKNQNHLVSSSALSLLPIYAEKLSSTSSHSKAHDVKTLLHATLPIVVERLGDHKEKVREGARNALIEMALAAFDPSGSSTAAAKDPHSSAAMFERLFKEAGMLAKSAKVKEQATLFLVSLRRAVSKFPLRPLLPSLVEQLSDADPGVREAARSTCINLFSGASPTAKSELKKEMEKKGVRKQTSDAILAQVMGSIPEGENIGDVKTFLTSAVHEEEVGRKPASRSASRMGAHELADDGISPVYITSQWDLDRTFNAMQPHFEGKETEHNWLAREQSIIKLRGMLRTDVHDNLYEHFITGLRNIHEGVLKATASLRTTLSIHALQLISELALQLREGLDVLTEPIVASIIKMAGFTKKLVASASQAAVRDILTHCTYRHKFLDLIWQNLQEKMVTTRAFMCGHLITLLQTHGSHRKHLLETHAGLDILEQCLKKALPDQNKDVRDKAREAFYLLEKIWPHASSNILITLDSATKKQVESNRGKIVNSSASTGASAATRVSAPPAAGRKSGAAGPSSAILAAKRAAAARLAQQRREEEEEYARAARGRDDNAEAQDGFQDDHNEADERLHQEERNQIEAESSVLLIDEREDDDEDGNEIDTVTTTTPVKPPPVTFPPITTPKSPLRSVNRLSNGSLHARSLSPSSIPLPVSPRSTILQGASLQSPSHIAHSVASPSSQHSAQDSRSRTASTASSSSSSIRSTGKLTSMASPSTRARFESFGQRVGQAVPASQSASSSRERNISTSSSSNTLSATPPSSEKRSPFMSSSSSSSRHLHAASGALQDETVQLEQIPDASMDLLSSSADMDLQSSSPSSFSATSKRHSAVTPRHGSSTAVLPLAITPRGASSSSAMRGPPSTGRSRLPRPVSVLYTSPTPASSKHTQSRSIDENTLSSPDSVDSQPLSRPVEAPPSSRVGDGQLQSSIEQSAEERRKDEDSSIEKASSSSSKWFLRKASRLDHARVDTDIDKDDSNLSPVKKRPESEIYISQLRSGQADVRTFKGLARICKEFQLPSEKMHNADEDVLSSSALGLAQLIQAKQEEKIAIAMWQQGSLFERLFAALSAYLDTTSSGSSSAQNRDLKTAALIVLHRLVENEFKLFEVLGKERDLIQLIFELIKINRASNVKSACQAIMESWSEQTNVIVGISTLRGIVSSYLAGISSPSTSAVGADEEATEKAETTSTLDPSTASAISIHTLSLRTLARLFQRLPVELIEEEVQRCKAMLKKGLNHWNIETRQQAVAVLVAANGKTNDPKSLFLILQPMERAQEDLLMYYMSKSGSR